MSPEKELTTKVNALIKEGWRPLGAAQLTSSAAKRPRMCIVQTMVKETVGAAELPDLVKLTDMVKLNEQVLTAMWAKSDEAEKKMTERIEAMITHFEEISVQIEEIRLAKDYD